jgi:hypothetical protein
MESVNHAKVVEIAFTKEEWKVLMGDVDFSQRMKYCCKTLDDVETLCAIGEGLITTWKQSKSPFGSLGG